MPGLIIARHLGCPQALPPYMGNLDPWRLLHPRGKAGWVVRKPWRADWSRT